MRDELMNKLKEMQAIGKCEYRGTGQTVAEIFDAQFNGLDALIKRTEQK